MFLSHQERGSLLYGRLFPLQPIDPGFQFLGCFLLGLQGLAGRADIAGVAALTDRYYVPVPDHIDRAGREITRRRPLNVFAPPSHHRPSALDVVGSVVGAPHLILVDVRQRDLNEFRVPPVFI